MCKNANKITSVNNSKLSHLVSLFGNWAPSFYGSGGLDLSMIIVSYRSVAIAVFIIL